MAWGKCQICHRDKELVDGKLPKHEDPNGDGLCRGGEEPPLAGFDVASMAIGDLPAHPRDSQGQYLNVGDRVRTSSGSTDEVVQVLADPDRVRLRGGQTVAASDVVKMSRELDAVDFARTTRCPYCTTTVALYARTIGTHRSPGGLCDGSGRRVAEFDYAGRAVLEAQSFGYVQADELAPGVRFQDTLTGKIYTVVEQRGYYTTVYKDESGNQQSESTERLVARIRLV